MRKELWVFMKHTGVWTLITKFPLENSSRQHTARDYYLLNEYRLSYKMDGYCTAVVTYKD